VVVAHRHRCLHSPGSVLPAPVLYPFTYRGFDGMAWNEPRFMVLNYLALVGCAAWVVRRRT
jgi:hypothetical protein